MKRNIISFLILALLTSSLVVVTHAQESDDTRDPFRRDLEEYLEPYDESKLEPLTPEQQREDELAATVGSIYSEIEKFEVAFGLVDDQGNYIPGALDALKLKPSDKRRLIKLANKSLTERQKGTIVYDDKLLDLLVDLAKPKELGGGRF